MHLKNFRVFTNTRNFFPCIQKNSVYLKNFRVLISIHGKHRPGEQTLRILIPFMKALNFLELKGPKWNWLNLQFEHDSCVKNQLLVTDEFDPNKI